MAVAFNGFKESLVTFKAAGGLTQAGVPVKISANDTVDICAAGDSFCGIANQVKGGYASVQMSGFATLAYSGTPEPAVGYCALAADGSSGVKAVTAGGKSLLVIHVDTVAKTVGVML